MFDQHNYEVRCESGLRGLQELVANSDVLIIVDGLSFSTSVDVATQRGAVVFPFPARGNSTEAYAKAGWRHHRLIEARFGIFVISKLAAAIPSGYRLLLPSPNGGALCYSARCFTACLRNAAAAARKAAQFGSTFAVVPAGEQWDSGQIRPGVEDLAGAGSLIGPLPGRKSPEALAASGSIRSFTGEPKRRGCQQRVRAGTHRQGIRARCGSRC